MSDGDDAPVAVGRPTLNVADLIGETKALAVHPVLARSTLDRYPTSIGSGVSAMELFTKLFGDLLAFVYRCFDRIVIHGYLSTLSRPEQVVHFFRQTVGVPVVSKEILSERTANYQRSWVDSFARIKQLDYWTFLLGPKFSAKERQQLNLSRASMPSPRSNIAATSSLSATFPSTTCSSAAANWACGDSLPTRLPRSSGTRLIPTL